MFPLPSLLSHVLFMSARKHRRVSRWAGAAETVNSRTDLASRTDLDERPTTIRSSRTGPDRIFRGVSMGAAIISLLIVVAIVIFLIDKSGPAYRHSGIVGFFTHSVFDGTSGKFGVLGLAENTALIALVALCVGVPTSLGMAIFINEYAPLRAAQVMTSAIDLLAALPSLLFGIWGKVALEGPIIKVATFFNHHLSILPFFRVPTSQTTTTPSFTGSTLQAGLVVGIMIIPMITSVSRDVMSQVPRDQCEGALALGSTRWGMVRDVILPFGRNGIVGGILLGLGRALGETIAILFVVEQVVGVNTDILTSGSGSIASLIAVRFTGGSDLLEAGLVGAGLTLFVLTLVVNIVARIIVSRAGRFS
jgi:phosphate transport system permease protein